MTTNPPPPSTTESESFRSLVVWNYYEVRYELQQPDPGTWAAIGLVTIGYGSDATQRRKLIVGRGPTEADAICDLRSRAMAKCPVPSEIHERFSVEWAAAESWKEGGRWCSGEDNALY